ncbi:MAG: hypothetical protein AB4041_21665 [Microcystaceae cyanobacterium]
MKSSLSSATLTGGLAMGLLAAYIPSAQAFETWSFNFDTPTQDCYLDSNQGTINCNTLETNNNNYISTGQTGGGTQLAFLKFDLTDVIQTLSDELDDEDFAFLTVTSANLLGFQSSDNPDNPNSTNPDPSVSRPTNFPAFRVTSLRARETLDDWDENDPNFTFDNFFGNDGIDDQLDSTNLFTGSIGADFSGLTPFPRTSNNLTARLEEIISEGVAGVPNAESELAFVIQSTAGLEFPPFLFEIEDFVNTERGEVDDTAFSLDLEIAVFSKADFDLFTRIGRKGSGDWESAFRNKRRNDRPLIEADFNWPNGRNIGNRIFFEWLYNDTNGDATLKLYDDDPNVNPSLQPFFDETVDTDRNDTDVISIEGLKLFTQVETSFCRKNDSSSGIRVDTGTDTRLRITSIIDNNNDESFLSDSQGTVNAFVSNSQSIGDVDSNELIVPFIDLGIDQAQQINGNFTIGWDDGENPQDTCDRGVGGLSRVQMLVEPLTTLPDPRVTSSDSEFLSASTDEDPVGDDEVETQSVPEPAAVIGLLFFGFAGLGFGQSSNDD